MYGLKENEDHPIESFECFVCQSIMNNSTFKKRDNSVYNCEEPNRKNWWYEHWYLGKCKAKALNLLINKRKVSQVVKKDFDSLYLKFYNEKVCWQKSKMFFLLLNPSIFTKEITTNKKIGVKYLSSFI